MGFGNTHNKILKTTEEELRRKRDSHQDQKTPIDNKEYNKTISDISSENRDKIYEKSTKETIKRFDKFSEDVVPLITLLFPTKKFPIDSSTKTNTDNILISKHAIDYLEINGIMPSKIISFNDFDGVYTDPHKNITVRVTEKKTKNPYTTLDIGHELNHFKNPRGFLRLYGKATGNNSPWPIYNKDGISKVNIETINNMIKENFHTVCRLDTQNARNNYFETIYTQLLHIVKSPHNTPLSKDIIYNFIRMSTLTDEIIISTISDHSLINSIAYAINQFIPNNSEDNPKIKAKGTLFCFDKDGRIPKNRINEMISPNFATNKIVDHKYIQDKFRSSDTFWMQTKCSEHRHTDPTAYPLLNPEFIRNNTDKDETDFKINIPIINNIYKKELGGKNSLKEIMFNSDNDEDPANLFVLAEKNENNIITFNAIIPTNKKTIPVNRTNTFPEKTTLNFVSDINGIIHNTTLKKAHYADICLLGINNMINIAKRATRIYHNIERRQEEILAENINPNDESYYDIMSETEIEFNTLLNYLKKINNSELSSIYNIIYEERENFISDENKIFMHFPTGDRLKFSGYVMSKEDIETFEEKSKEIEEDLKKPLYEKKIDNKELTSTADKIRIKRHDVDISELQHAISKVLTSERTLKKLHPDENFGKQILSYSEKIRQYKNRGI